jgi:hypothetical protein
MIPRKEIKIASVPHREKLVAELWYGDEAFCELSIDTGDLIACVFPNSQGEPLEFQYDDLIAFLEEGKRKLLGKGPVINV